MVGKRDSIIGVINYLEELGIDVNIGKNTARGNKGFFKSNGLRYRIDISKNLDCTETLSVLVHEFAHFVHYKFDKTLKSLDFILTCDYSDIEEEFLKLTVAKVPKDTAKTLFEQKYEVEKEIKLISNDIKKVYPDFLLSKPYKKVENIIKKTNLKYLLKHDRVLVKELFTKKIYTIENIEKDFFEIDSVILDYVKLKSKQRYKKRISARITKLNSYYNTKTELFARAFESFVLNPEQMELTTPMIYKEFVKFYDEDKFKFVKDFIFLVKII